uniref:Uncharacterized protein n=1 Tax=Operophtera brumata cypovirus 18 TaxID=352244 RepID=Q30C71_9REOV|nr:unknown [Operophtera brumata cypovirus 18]
MEAYIRENRKPKTTNTAPARTFKQATHRLVLPAYDALVESLRNRTNAHIKLELPATEQIHMVWVRAGLLFFIPTSTHPAYINFSSRDPSTNVPALTKQTFPTSDSSLVERTPLPSGTDSQVASYKLFTWKEGASKVLDEMNRDATNFLNVIQQTFKSGDRRLTKERYYQAINAESRDFCNHMKFVLLGRLCFSHVGNPPPVEMYQFGIVPFIAADIICEGAAYRPIDFENYKTNGPNMIQFAPFFLPSGDASSKVRDDLCAVYHLKKFNLLFDSWHKTGGSALVSSRPQTERIVSGSTLIPTSLTPLAVKELTFDDADIDSDSDGPDTA